MNNIVLLNTINGIGDKLINVIGAAVYCYYKKFELKESWYDLFVIEYKTSSTNFL
jgi:hypothetical protein